jgi:hypothetical protein
MLTKDAMTGKFTLTIGVQKATQPTYLVAFPMNGAGFTTIITAKRHLRTFALHRLTKPQLTAEKFAKPKNFDPAELLGGSLNVFKGREDHDILINSIPGPPTKSATAAGTPPNKSHASRTAHASCVFV